MNRGLSIEWEVRELLGLWLQQLFSLFSGYHASYLTLAVILSHLNVIFFHMYSKMSAVFLTMALLFRCLTLLAYRLKKRRTSACSSCFFLLAPTFISFKHQWQSDWAVFSNDAASRRLRAQPSVQSRGGGGGVTPFCFPHVPPKVYGGYAHAFKEEKVHIWAGAREGVLCRGCCVWGGGGCSQFLRINITPNRNRKSCYSLRTFMRSC